MPGGALVRLCRLPPGAEAQLPAAEALLPPAARVGLDRSRRPADRMARAMTRLLLRSTLTELGAESALAGWQTAPGGRPFLAGCALDISISHAGPWLGAAVGTGLRLGLDLEARAHLQPEDLAPLLTTAEHAALAAAPDPTALLLRRWCLREAVLKADGRGLALPEAALRAMGDSAFPNARHWHLDFCEWPEGGAALAMDRVVEVDWQWREAGALLGP